jgi:hypothetical protein
MTPQLPPGIGLAAALAATAEPAAGLLGGVGGRSGAFNQGLIAARTMRARGAGEVLASGM